MVYPVFIEGEKNQLQETKTDWEQSAGQLHTHPENLLSRHYCSPSYFNKFLRVELILDAPKQLKSVTLLSHVAENPSRAATQWVDQGIKAFPVHKLEIHV
jgi:hypothetical protein